MLFVDAGSKGKEPQASSMSKDARQVVVGNESTINGNNCLFTSSIGVGTKLASSEEATYGNQV